MPSAAIPAAGSAGLSSTGRQEVGFVATAACAAEAEKRTVQLHEWRCMQVTSEDFDAMMETIGKTLDEKGVAEADKKD